MNYKSSKQKKAVDSTCESEYTIACEEAKETTWLKNFIGDLRFILTVEEPMYIFCDNEGVVALTKEP